MGRTLYRKHYEEIRGYRMSDHSVSDISEIAKENYYALAMAIINGWSAEYCLIRMGIGAEKKEYTYKVEPPYQQISTFVYALNKFCGMSYYEISKVTKIAYHLVRDGVMFKSGKRRKRKNASRYETSTSRRSKPAMAYE